MRVTSEATVPARQVSSGIQRAELIQLENGSELALTAEKLAPGSLLAIAADDDDLLLFAYQGSGVLQG